MNNSKFPKVLFATLDLNMNSREPENINAHRVLNHAVDDEVTYVGEYQLISVRKYRKQVLDVSVPPRGKR